MIFEALLILLAGGSMLVLGGDFLVRGAVRIAAGFRLPPAVIGVTLMGFGTSMPEMMASVEAALLGSPAIALGNAIGSNTANILLILGASALIAPIAAPWQGVRRDLLWVGGAAAVLVVAMFWGELSRAVGAVFLLCLAAYTWVSLRSPSDDLPVPVSGSLAAAVAWAGIGIAGLLWGASLFVGAAVDLARLTGVSEAVIGVSIVAVGTSLPELAASVAAARRGESGLALGNVLGSNVFNILGVLGVAALVSPLVPGPEILGRDLWVMIAATIALFAVIAVMGRIGRGLGMVFLAAYAAYIVAIV